MSEFQAQLHAVLSDRHAPEARELFLRLMRYVHSRVLSVWSHACRDLVDTSARDEVVGEVLEELISGALARFRGESIGELLAYVRRITDRTLLHRARRSLRERRALEGTQADEIRAWSVRLPDPDSAFSEVVENPLPASDQAWLSDLFRSGSMAEHARRTDVSRAAVTLRVQRIRARIDALGPAQKDAVEGWLEHAAREARGG